MTGAVGIHIGVKQIQKVKHQGSGRQPWGWQDQRHRRTQVKQRSDTVEVQNTLGSRQLPSGYKDCD